MSLNGSGVFNVNSAGQPVVAGTLITAAAFNAYTADVAAALSTALHSDGQRVNAANQNMARDDYPVELVTDQILELAKHQNDC